MRKEAGPLRLLAAYCYVRSAAVVPNRSRVDLPGLSLFSTRETHPPHGFRALVSYNFAGVGSVSAIYRYDVGTAYDRLYRIDAGAGVNPGANLNDPADDRPTRRPDQSRLNLHVDLRTKRLTGHDFGIYADFINLFGKRTVIASDASFTSITVDPGLWMRLGLQYRY